MARTRRATVAPAPAATVTMTPAAMRQAIAEGVNAILDERAAAQQAQNGGIGVQAAPAARRYLVNECRNANNPKNLNAYWESGNKAKYEQI
ncbi:hypothetical protein CTI12_AA180190 [Artemisia annua]|uniref:Uncharacterized protein n=1 Tax=Artemisia annua TaxID=35608 RepID=A0A2U1P8X1_ARTAN|nr:hypothetical protein CTI12_AA180190 [Artemisia annua]